MKITGKNIIGYQLSSEGTKTFSATNPATLTPLEPEFAEATSEEIEKAFDLADEAFESFQEVTRERRAVFLEAIADEILALGETLIHRAMEETGLPEARIIGERGRTMNQLKLFASVVRDGSFLEASIDTAQPDRTPIPKPDIRMINVALGPVSIFGASNFPLAFSVAGGDTASAIAAGCSVVVKAHPAHPGTSELVGLAIRQAAEESGMPNGIFSLLQGAGIEVGQQMVQHPLASAVAFTGSFNGGKALFDLANARPNPIPCFAEMGSINPVFLLPDRLQDNAVSIAQQYVDSLTLGVGQFCTNPGIVIGIEGKALDSFVEAAIEKTTGNTGGTMLHEGIKSNYDKAVANASEQNDTEVIASGSGEGATIAAAQLLKTSASALIHNENLQNELFGPASIIVGCKNDDEMLLVARTLHGNLTATLHATEEDLKQYKQLIKVLERKVGRILVNGFPTGVEVCHSMVHGGPFPATTDSRFTSVGTSAIKRFLRPVCYQNFPESALKEELKNNPESSLLRKIDGTYQNE